MEFASLNRGRNSPRIYRPFAFMRHVDYYETTEGLSLLGYEQTVKAAETLISQITPLFKELWQLKLHIFFSPCIRAQNTGIFLGELLRTKKFNVDSCYEMEWLASDRKQITEDNIAKVLNEKEKYYGHPFCIFISHAPDLEEYTHEGFEKGQVRIIKPIEKD